jgi:hypothetical protein
VSGRDGDISIGYRVIDPLASAAAGAGPAGDRVRQVRHRRD